MNEEQEFEELALLEEFEAQEAAALEQDDSYAEQEVDETGKAVVQQEQGMLNTAQAAALGAVEGVPFAKDALAAGETFIETGLDDFGENFNKNQDEWNDVINKAEEDHPYAFTAGDIASGFALPAGRGIKAAMAFGGISALSRSEDRDIWDVAAGAAIGGVASKVIGGVINQGAKAINFVGNKMGLYSERSVSASLVGGGNRVKVNQHIRKFFNDGGKKTQDEATHDFAEYILKQKTQGKALLEKTDTSDSLAIKFNSWREDTNTKIASLLKKNDRILDDSEVRSIYTSHRAAMNLDDLSAAGPEAAKKAGKLLKKLDDEYLYQPTRTEKVKKFTGLDGNGKQIYEEVLEKVNDGPPQFHKLKLTELHKKKRFFGDTAHNSFDKVSGTYKIDDIDYYKKGAQTLGEGLDNLTSDTGLLKSLNKEWATANMGQQTLRDVVNSTKDDAVTQLKRQLNLRTIFLAAGAGTAMTGNIPAAVGIATVGTMIHMSNNPNIHPKMALGLRKLASHLKVNPSSELYKRIGIASSLSNDAFRETISSALSEVSLMNEAVARDTQTGVQRSDDILGALQYHDKEAASLFRKALKSKDENVIGEALDRVSKMPEMSKFFKEGLGINGKVYSQEDKAMLTDQLMGNSDISLSQRMQHKDALLSAGTIPQVQPDDREPIKHIPRRKDKHEY